MGKGRSVMDRKDDLLRQLRQFPNHKMKPDKQEEIFKNIMQQPSPRKLKKKRSRWKTLSASIASIAAVVIFVILGLGYLTGDGENSSGNPEEPSSKVPLEENKNNDNNERDDNKNDIASNENDENDGNYSKDIAMEPMDKEWIRFIINKTISDINEQSEIIVDSHPEWLEEFRFLHEGDREYPDEFYDAVELFYEKLSPFMTERALDEYGEGLVLMNFCQCGGYHRWSEHDTENNFEVYKQTKNEFIATSDVQGTDFSPQSLSLRWHFKRDNGKWKLEKVDRDEIN